MDDLTDDMKANENNINFQGTVSYGAAVIIVDIVVHLANVALFFTGIAEARAARLHYRLRKAVIARQEHKARLERELAD
uniref:Anoctamin n=1 Tax=Panagrellus redivivus TaxID=6233 RepID=A0A7E4WCT6_PANRE